MGKRFNFKTLDRQQKYHLNIRRQVQSGIARSTQDSLVKIDESQRQVTTMGNPYGGYREATTLNSQQNLDLNDEVNTGDVVVHDPQ